MSIKFRSLRTLILVSIIFAAFSVGLSQDASKGTETVGDAVLWEPVDIRARNLFLGPGGAAMRPKLKRVTFIKKETGGNNLKYRIKDASGKVWVAKIADESQPETVAVRLLWGLGYKTEVNYLVPRLAIPGVGKFKNARLEARPADVDRQERWSWEENPFAGTNELQGLKIMMALINNWDLKTGNNIILQTRNDRQYVVSDLGSAFGKLPAASFPILNRFGRSVNNPEHYVKSKFVNGIDDDGQVDFAYKGKAAKLLDGITPEHAQWIANLLRQLSDKQIRDAFRAANYSPAQSRMLTRAVRARIKALELQPDRLEAKR